MQLNKIYNIDCVEGMKTIPDEFVDLTVTSPPYDNLRKYKGFTFKFESVAYELFRITKNGGVVVWIVNDATINGSETLSSSKQKIYFAEVGFNIHDTMIYGKENWVPLTHNRYEQQFEYMFVLSKGKPKTFNPLNMPTLHAGKMITRSQNNEGENKSYRERKVKRETPNVKRRGNIWMYKIGTNCSATDEFAFKHPAIFPEQLAEDHILSWSNEGDIVLDPFMGSGTTAKMALMNRRNYIRFEISQEYIEISDARLSSINS